MENLMSQVAAQPVGLYISLFLLVVLAVAGIARRQYTTKKIKKEAGECAELHPAFQNTYSFSQPVQRLSRRYPLVKRLSRRYGINFPILMHLDDYWISRMEQHPSSKIMERLLAYAPEKALFVCFQGALGSDRLFEQLKAWIEKSGELMVMSTLARSCAGRDFDGKRALSKVETWKEELYEMTGDPSWQIRWFALRILLHDANERAEKAVWQAFQDPSAQIRRMIAEKSSFQDKSKLYRQLEDLLLNDPVYSVRSQARWRIEEDFKDYYAIPSSLSHTQKLHLTELLNPDLPQDREFAFSLLDGENDELSLEASRILSKSGSLHRLFQQVFHEDRQNLARTLHLLSHAARVHATEFLEVLYDHDNPGTLLAAAKLLREHGDLKYSTILARRVCAFRDEQKEHAPLRSIYLDSLETACLRGDDQALSVVRDELSARRHDTGLQEKILPLLPPQRAHVYIKTLFDFLKDESYQSNDVLRETIAKLDPEFSLPSLFDLIKANDDSLPPGVQEEALRVLCEIGLPYTVQHILEHLPILSPEKASQYSELIGQHFVKEYQQRVTELLQSTDATLRSRLISSVPAQFYPNFRDQLLKALQDSVPEVRSASAWSILPNGSKEDIKSCLNLLHDPVESVRINAAKAFAMHADDSFFNELSTMLNDQSEMLPVKTSLIQGLQYSRYSASVDVLVEQLTIGGELQEAALKSLSEKRDRQSISRLLSHVKKADPQSKKLLVEIVRSMGGSGESVLEAFLFDHSNPLRSVAIDVLESIGSVDSQIRHLTNRDPSVRRDAASFLFQVGTTHAYRGLVQAARDPDEEVRTFVVKALDALNSDKGKAILEELKNDPVKKVRTYTNWALERYKAKRL